MWIDRSAQNLEDLMMTKHFSIVAPSSVLVDPDMSGQSISGDTQFPHLPPNKDVVLKHWTLVSADLITAVRNAGQNKSTFKRNIVDGHHIIP